MGFCVSLLIREEMGTVMFAEIDRDGINMSGRMRVFYQQWEIDVTSTSCYTSSAMHITSSWLMS